MQIFAFQAALRVRKIYCSSLQKSAQYRIRFSLGCQISLQLPLLYTITIIERISHQTALKLLLSGNSVSYTK